MKNIKLTRLGRLNRRIDKHVEEWIHHHPFVASIFGCLAIWVVVRSFIVPAL